MYLQPLDFYRVKTCMHVLAMPARRRGKKVKIGAILFKFRGGREAKDAPFSSKNIVQIAMNIYRMSELISFMQSCKVGDSWNEIHVQEKMNVNKRLVVTRMEDRTIETARGSQDRKGSSMIEKMFMFTGSDSNQGKDARHAVVLSGSETRLISALFPTMATISLSVSEKPDKKEQIDESDADKDANNETIEEDTDIDFPE